MPIEDFTGHGVDARRYCITLFLCDLRKTFALGEVAANDAIVALVGATLP